MTRDMINLAEEKAQWFLRRISDLREDPAEMATLTWPGKRQNALRKATTELLRALTKLHRS